MTHYIQLKLQTLITELNKGDFFWDKPDENFWKMCLRKIFKERFVLEKQRCHFNLARFKDFSRTSLLQVSSAASLGSSYLRPEFQTPLTDLQELGVNVGLLNPLHFSIKKKNHHQSSLLASSAGGCSLVSAPCPACSSYPALEQFRSAFERRGCFTLARFLHSSTTMLRKPAAAA